MKITKDQIEAITTAIKQLERVHPQFDEGCVPDRHGEYLLRDDVLDVVSRLETPKCWCGHWADEHGPCHGTAESISGREVPCCCGHYDPNAPDEVKERQ